MRDDLRPQIAPKPPQYGRTSASKCHPPCRADMPTRSLQGHTRATAVRQRYAPLPNWPLHSHHQHTSRAAIHRLQPDTQHYGQPNSSPAGATTHTPQPSLHNHQSIPLTSTGTHPPPTSNRPTPQPTQTPSGQADSALQTEYTHKLPVVRSQHAESALLPGAAVHQRHSKGTPMAHQNAIYWWF